ncbi:hypothetical protein [Winogradskyella thalassocola]|uniref:Lipoprotein n=1 Tax=Winogradskyella thalassocola TaxID=262004 RepID=A0A1G8G0U1_9FLAO|nr:hypothetical protein [Winogradskyella thalassocola]SDH88004.1 hypothetical protein SAMN04489796_10557 [Winogradskyella thalassocola]
MIKKFSILCSLLMLYSCNSDNIEFLEVYYYSPGPSTPSRTFCSSNLFISTSSEVRYKKLVDKSFLVEFENQLKKLKPSDEFSINSRAFALINYRDGNIDTLCVGEYRGICLNGDIKIHNQEFHNLMLNEIDFYDKKLNDEMYKDKLKTNNSN